MAISDQKLKNIIKAYRKLRGEKPDIWIDFAREQAELRSAIIVSALCINAEGKRHPHQYRLKKQILEATKDELLLVYKRISKAKTFDALYKIVDSLDVYGLGKLTRYDIAQRIGAFLELTPDRVYLHAGTMIGAKKLLGDIRGKEYLTKDDLPKSFRVKSLKYHEIEDILCIFKDNLDFVDPAIVSSKRC